MKKYLTFLILLICCGFLNGQNFQRCDIYQYKGTDSLNKFISLTRLFNSSGQIVMETYKDYMRNASEGHLNRTYCYFYEDTLLVRRTSIDDEGDSTKISYYYNYKNQLIKRDYYTFERRVKENVEWYVLSDEDFEEERTWLQTSSIEYSYDEKGHKILYDATKLHYSIQNKYTWLYDSLGRVVEYYSFDNDRLIWLEEFTYFDDGYSFTRTWYDDQGNLRHLKEKWDYSPQYTFTHKLNEKGQVIEKKVTDEKGEKGSKEITTYNSNGDIEKFTSYDSNEEPVITHIYVYY